MNIIATALEKLIEASEHGGRLSDEEVWKTVGLSEQEWAQLGKRTAGVVLQLFVRSLFDEIAEGENVPARIAKYGGNLLSVRLSDETRREAISELADLFIEPTAPPEGQVEDMEGVKWVESEGKIVAILADKTLAEEGISKHALYVERLFDLLYRKRLEALREHGIERMSTEPEFAQLGMEVTYVIFNILVAFHPRAVEQGVLDVEAVWANFMATSGHDFAKDLIEPNRHPLMPATLWKWFIESVLRNAALSFSQIVEESESR